MQRPSAEEKKKRRSEFCERDERVTRVKHAVSTQKSSKSGRTKLFPPFSLGCLTEQPRQEEKKRTKKKAVSNLSTGLTSTALEQAKQTHIKTHDDYSLLFSVCVFFFF